MRSPEIGCARRPSPSGCRRYDICFGTAVGNPASQSQSPCRNKPYPRLYPSRTQRSGFARERRSNEAIRSFRRKAETERAQFAPTRRRLSSSGCRGYNICFGTAVGHPASQSQRPCASAGAKRPPFGKGAPAAGGWGIDDLPRAPIPQPASLAAPFRKGSLWCAACDELVRPPGIFASARRKGTRCASAAHRA